MKKFSAHKYGLEFINGAKEANRPFLSSYGWNLFPLKDPREDNTYDMYTIGHFTETPYHNNLAISHLYPKIAADLMTKNAKAVNLCLLNLHCVHNIDSMLHKFLYERGVPVMVQGCDESLNGREHYLNSYYLFLNTMDIRAVLAASLNSISHSGLDEERKNELRSHFIADFKAFVRVGSSLLKEYDVRKQLHRNSQNPDILKAPKPFQG